MTKSLRKMIPVGIGMLILGGCLGTPATETPTEEEGANTPVVEETTPSVIVTPEVTVEETTPTSTDVTTTTPATETTTPTTDTTTPKTE